MAVSMGAASALLLYALAKKVHLIFIAVSIRTASAI
jgi:hypothetical protein